MGARAKMAHAAGRAVAAALHALGRPGTTLPGKVALKLDPSFLADSARGVAVVLVTGTNGKTTTTHLLAETALTCGFSVVTNAGGANMTAGLAGAFVAEKRAGGRRRMAVLECDEAYVRQVAGALTPAAIVVTNLFRDQLDRWGEVTRTLELLREGLDAAPGAVAVLNADDSLVASLAEGRADGSVRFFGLGEAFAKADETTHVILSGGCEAPAAEGSSASAAGIPAPKEGITCVKCGTPLAFAWTTYGHLGAFSCPTCGFSRPTPHVEGTAPLSGGAEGTRIRVLDGGETAELDLPLPATYNLYNALAALAAAEALGISRDDALAALARTDGSFGRMEAFTCGGTPVRMILVKNPVGLDQALAYVRDAGGYARLIFGLNDKTGDGTDISWIWDAECEGFFAACGAGLTDVRAFGTRAEDMALRLKYAGAPEAVLRTIPWGGDEHAMYDAVVGAITASPEPVCVLVNYTAMFDLRRELGKRYHLRSMG